VGVPAALGIAGSGGVDIRGPLEGSGCQEVALAGLCRAPHKAPNTM
jgi:hypothetical protein